MIVAPDEAPEILAVIPTLAGDVERLRRCVDAVRAQRTDRRVAILVVVNGETPPDPVEGAVIVVAGLNLGWAGGLGLGRAVADAPLLWLVQDDMLPDPECLAALAATLDDDPDLGLVAPLVVRADGTVPAGSCGGIVDGDYDIPRWLPERDLPADELGDLSGLGYVPSRGMLVRSADWDRVGGMDPRFYPVQWADVDLCTALRHAGRQFALCRDARTEHSGQASTPRPYGEFLFLRNRAQFQRKWRDGEGAGVPHAAIPTGILAGVAASATQALRELSRAYGAHQAEQTTVPFSHSERENAQRELAQRDHQIAALAEKLSVADQAFAAIHEAAIAAQQDAAALRASRSWRITAPLRAVTAALRRRRTLR